MCVILVIHLLFLPLPEYSIHNYGGKHAPVSWSTCRHPASPDQVVVSSWLNRSHWSAPGLLGETSKRPHLLAQPPFPPTKSLSYTPASCSRPYCLCSRRCTRPDTSCLYCPWCTCPSTACTTPQSSPSAAECPV